MSAMDEYKYAVALAPGKSSFYDPVSRCNLFLTRKAFGFNIEPTINILTAIRYGTLVDLKGNLKETGTVRIEPEQLAQLQGATFQQQTAAAPPPKLGGGKARGKGAKQADDGQLALDNLPAGKG